MGKIAGTYVLACGLLFAGLSFFGFWDYAAKQSGNELLKESSSYVRMYEGGSPQEPLDYLKESLNTVKRSGAFQGINSLEREVEFASSAIGNSENPEAYRPMLETIGTDVDAVARENAPSSGDLFRGIFGGLMALIDIPGSVFVYRKRRKSYRKY